MSILVHKYGGTSVADEERIRNVARRVIRAADEGHRMVVVVSAQGDTTDHLIELARRVNPWPSDRELDMLLAVGEQISISLVAMTIEAMGRAAISLTAAQVGIFTDDAHKKARIIRVNSRRLDDELAAGKIVVVAGFQGVDRNNDLTTLGRGGSDTTAVALAAALGAVRCEIYTDVDGVYTADPRVVKGACKLTQISHEEMLELASLGAQVLHPRSVELAKQYGVKLEVKSSFADVPGTLVKEAGQMEDVLQVSGVTSDKNIARVAILEVPDRPGVAYKVMGDLAAGNVNVDMIIQSVSRDHINDMSFTIGEDDLDRAMAILNKTIAGLGAKGVVFDRNVAKVSIVGIGLKEKAGVATAMFQALAENGINIQMISSSEIKVSCLIERGQADLAVRAIHDKFFTGGVQVAREAG
ncbi:MAG: aspartate kinase [Bacillota bacterium]